MSGKSRLRIVILEDDEALRRAAVRALQDKGFGVTAPEDFKSAMETIERADAIDLIIADIGLWPGTPHGIALGNMAQLRRYGLKVIYMSGTHDVKWAATYGEAAAILQKPFSAEKLIETIIAVLDKPAEEGA